VCLRKDHCTGHPRVIAEHGVDHFCAAPIVLATLPQSPAAAGRWAALGARTDRVVPAASWRPEVHRFDSAGVLLFVDERASWMALEALQTFGAAGYGAASVAARLLRDAKFFSIGFGTNEIRRIVIGRDLLTIKVTAALLTRKRRPERGGIADSLLSQSEIFDIRDLPLRIPFFSYSILFGLGRPL
jgi:Acyl-CoA dehydrogenase, C-terminal domain